MKSLTRPLTFTIIWNLTILILGMVYTPLFSLYCISFIVACYEVINFWILPTPGDLPIGLFTIGKLKKITHQSNLFYTYVESNDEMVILYEDRIFYLKFHSRIKLNHSNLDDIKFWIRKKVDGTYSKKEVSAKVAKQLREWDGTIQNRKKRKTPKLNFIEKKY